MTLIEALVVVALTALISAIGFPMLRGGGSERALRSQSAALVVDLRRARAAAIHLDRPVALTTDPDGEGWRWTGGALRVDAGAGLRVAGQGVTFFPDGTATGAHLELRSARHAIGVDIDRATGNVATTRR